MALETQVKIDMNSSPLMELLKACKAYPAPNTDIWADFSLFPSVWILRFPLKPGWWEG